MARQALKVLVRSLGDLWDNLFVLLAANLVWAVSLMPPLAIMVFVGGTVSFIIGPLLFILIVGPTTLALYSFTIEVTRQEKIEFGEYWRGLKRYYRRGWLVGLLNTAFIVLVFFNFLFYTTPDISRSPLGLGLYLWISFSFMWFCLQIFLWPLTVRMEVLKLGNLLRNAFLATFKYPVLSILVGFALALFFLASYFLVFLPVILVGMTYHALVSNRALSAVLERERQQAAALETDGKPPAFQVEVPDLPDPEPETTPTYTTRNTPPGVKQRGNPDISNKTGRK